MPALINQLAGFMDFRNTGWLTWWQDRGETQGYKTACIWKKCAGWCTHRQKVETKANADHRFGGMVLLFFLFNILLILPFSNYLTLYLDWCIMGSVQYTVCSCVLHGCASVYMWIVFSCCVYWFIFKAERPSTWSPEKKFPTGDSKVYRIVLHCLSYFRTKNVWVRKHRQKEFSVSSHRNWRRMGKRKKTRRSIFVLTRRQQRSHFPHKQFPAAPNDGLVSEDQQSNNHIIRRFTELILNDWQSFICISLISVISPLPYWAEMGRENGGWMGAGGGRRIV